MQHLLRNLLKYLTLAAIFITTQFFFAQESSALVPCQDNGVYKCKSESYKNFAEAANYKQEYDAANVVGSRWRAGKMKQYQFIINNQCTAKSFALYSGETYYECPNGKAFWSDLIVPVPNPELASILTAAQHNRKSDDDAAMIAAMYAPISTGY